MSTEPTFTLAEIVDVFGTNYSSGPVDSHRVAVEALDDAGRAMLVAYNALDGEDEPEVCDALYNAKCRTEVAITILCKLRQASGAPSADDSADVRDLASALASKARPQ